MQNVKTILTFLLLSGLYLIGFGIWSISIMHFIGNGLAILCIGLLCTMLAGIGFKEQVDDRPHGPDHF